MVDVLDFLVNFLCQANTQSQCWEFINGYADPTQQLVFFLFFPTIFVIIFITELSNTISASKKLGVLFSLAIYMFIVFQGWYYIALTLSKMWFIAVIILVGFWVVLTKMGAGGGGGTRGGNGNTGRSLLDAAKKIAIKNTALNPYEIAQLRTEIERLEQAKNALEKQKKHASGERGMEEFDAKIAEIERELSDLRNRAPPGMK